MIDIICVRGLGDKEAPEIEDSFITSEPVAVKRGTNYLNSVWYRRRKRTILGPLKAGVAVSNVATVNVGLLGITDTHSITGYSITISPARGVECTLSIEQHRENT